MRRINRGTWPARAKRLIPSGVAALMTLAAGSPAAAAPPATTLPVPCLADSCGVNGPPSWVTGGRATATQSGSTLTVNQSSDTALLNWQSFNVSADGTVRFNQPAATSLAVNRIFQADPSQIFGVLSANGRIYLINQNGILFGAGSQVNVAGLVASTLDLTPDAVKNGIAGVFPGSPTAAFQAFRAADGTSTSKPIAVEAGATINAPGGQIFLFAPKIDNRGTLKSPDGQTILAAGEAVLLAASTDPNVRGLVVQIDKGGTVTNGTTDNASVTDPAKLVGQILAARGNVTLMGLAVNQQGLVSATTSVRANGTIKLIASDTSSAGAVTLGAASRTEALLDASDTGKAVDSTAQPRSTIDIVGGDITLTGGASVTAPSGAVTLSASQANSNLDSSKLPTSLTSNADTSRIYIAAGASIDVSGATATLPMESNVLQVQLRGSELADQPLQRNGALRGKTISVDVRQYGTRPDGSTWQGTPLADLAGDIATIQRGVAERNVTGGTVTLASQGDVIVAPTARIDISGGAVNYLSGVINTSVLLGADGRTYDVANASPDRLYTGITNTSTVSVLDQRWGVTQQYTGIFGPMAGHFEPGYIQGADAGSLKLDAPHLIFDGSLVASVTAGPNQRKPPAPLAAATLLRPFDQFPQAGALQIGAVVSLTDGAFQSQDAVAPAITFNSTPVLPTLSNPDGSRFNPLTDPFPASLNEIRLNPALIGPGAAGRIALYANGSIAVPSDVSWQLPPGGSFSALGGSIDFGGSLSGSGASVALRTLPILTLVGRGGIRLEPTATIDVAGAWVNDSPALNSGVATAPLAIAGGSVTLVARDGDLMLAPGAVIDASGGAQLAANGALRTGTAGAVTLGASAPDLLTPAHLSLGATLRGYGAAQGGALSVVAASICVHDASACDTPLFAGGLELSSSFFNTGGFGSYNLATNFGGFELARGTQLRPIQQNFLLTGNLALVASAPALHGIAPLGILDEAHRSPVNLAFASHFAVPGGAVTPDVFAGATDLVLGTSSAIVLDPLASLSLTSDTRILDDGLIAAPAGRVSMRISNALHENDYVSGHKIWLGDHAIVDLRGTVGAVPDDLGHMLGNVFAGGALSLTADRGTVETLQGSRIDVSGTTSRLDVPQLTAGGAATYQSTIVASAGGSVSVTAAEAALLSGTLVARSGDPARAAGGTFSLQLDLNQRYGNADRSSGVPPAYPYNTPTIELAQAQPPIALGPRTGLPAAYDARALVGASALTNAGLDSVNLQAVALDLSGSPRTGGQILFRGNVSLSVGQRLTLDAASFLSDGGQVALNAPYVALGNTRPSAQDLVGSSAAGRGALAVNADQIDLIGTSVLSGFNAVSLSSRGDIRAIGVQPPSVLAVTGGLTAPGSLLLDAQQVYPATLTAFSLTAGAGGSGTLRIADSFGTAPAMLLSAAGQLSLQAPEIIQAGVLRAPIGSIVLSADRITLAPGSTTSTSANGQTIPFGATQGGFDWAYPLAGGTLVYGAHGAVAPAQSIQLNGKTVDLQRGAVLDASGGGDLLATEFVPGPTGTQDVLSAATTARTGAFAILPVSGLRFGAYDPYYANGSAIQAGDSVYLSGGGGIAAGTYAVLPARYALLPGAYYVAPVSGYSDLVAGQQIAKLDGSTIVSGYRVVNGTPIGGGRTSGFDVTPGTAVQRLADYTSTTANTFFAGQAASAGISPTRLPHDAGTVALSATTELRLDGTLAAAAGSGGRGAAVDITSAAIRIVNASQPVAAVPGTLDVDAASLNALGAESILLGGLRSVAPGGLGITTRASTVEVASGARLNGPELMFAATSGITVDGNVVVAASGTLPFPDSKLLLSGDGALLRVAAGGDPQIGRSAAIGAQGQLTISSGALVQAPGGAVAIESSAGAQLAGTLNVTGGAFSITGSQLSLGNAPTGTGGTVLPTSVLNGLATHDLTLVSRGSMDFYDGVSLAGTNITLTAGALRGFASSGTHINASQRLMLAGTATGGAAAVPGIGQGGLDLEGANVTLDGGNLDVSGFGATTLAASNVVRLTGAGQMNVAGSLTLRAGLLSADSGAQRGFTASGTFSYGAAPGGVPAGAAAADGLGASVAIAASVISFDGSARLGSGLLSLTATGAGGNVAFGPHTMLDLSGVNTTFDSVGVASRGGTLLAASRFGSISAASGSQISVAALNDTAADAGRVSVAAPNGNVTLSGQLTGRGADFLADAQSLGDIAALDTLLGSGGFTGTRSLRLRGPGDITVGTASGEAIAARSVALTADQGSVVVNGTITSHAPSGGAVTLSARGDVVVNGTIDARPVASGEMNGHVELRSTSGGVMIASGARVAAYDPAVPTQSLADGALLIRAPPTTLSGVGTPGSHFLLAGDLSALRAVTIEGFRAYNPSQLHPGDAASLTAADTAPDPVNNPLFADAAAFMAGAPALLQALGPLRGPTPQIVPGIEIVATGPLTLTSDWALDAWRFSVGSGGAVVPGVLTLRASGDLTFAKSLSDGFTGTLGAAAYTLTSRDASWSYRLTAGADLAASDPLAVRSLADITDGSGSLIVAGGTLSARGQPPAMTMIRTGTGSIDIAAARDVRLTNTTSVIYTAGIATDGQLFGRPGQFIGQLYPAQGGNIAVSAGNDVLGAPGNSQLVTDWLWRVGTNLGTKPPTAWTVNFATFASDIGALGGGNVKISAGHDVADLAVNAPTIGRRAAGSTLGQGAIEIVGGGDINVTAGHDVAGGSIYAGRGSALVVAGNQIKDSPTSAGLFPVIALGDASAIISARDGLTLGAAVNPTLLPQGSSQHASRGANISYFSTYGDNAALTLRTLAGNAELVNDTSVTGALRSTYSSLPFAFPDPNGIDPGGGSALRIYPGTLNVAALRGDVKVDNTLTLYPQAHGGLQLLAQDSVLLGGTNSGGTNSFELIQSDADLSLLPSVSAPQGAYDALSNLLSTSLTPPQSIHAPTPVRLSAGAPNPQPSRIIALTGDVAMGAAGQSLLAFAGPARIVAGRDVVQLGADFQNLLPTDASSVVAGRDITYLQTRDVNGVFNDLRSLRYVAIDGPGTLEVWSGRDLNLQTAAGITSRGNLVNTALPAQGADVSIETGIGATGLDYAAFIDRYLVKSADYAAALMSYMQPRLGGVPSRDQALPAFEGLPSSEQAPLIETIFFDELRASGRSAAQPGAHSGDFTRGFAAIGALFPGGNPDPANGETNPFAGNLSLYFSRVYTLSGGDIRLLAPGGEINAGLASPPVSFGITKAPSELGIVAQGTGSVSGYSFKDFAVNESRVFAANGGDILIWSTRGNIDAGRGAKTAISAPPPTITFDRNGVPVVSFPAALTGSGIQTLATSAGVSPGNVDLFAPRGVVNANDAGIVAGNLTIAATAVLGADNIKVSGVSVGVPVETGGLGASLAAVSSVASSATQAATQGVDESSRRGSAAAPASEAAVSWLDVFIEGFGEEMCKPADVECLKRQKAH